MHGVDGVARVCVWHARVGLLLHVKDTLLQWVDEMAVLSAYTKGGGQREWVCGPTAAEDGRGYGYG